MEDVGIHTYFMAISYILHPFGIFCDHLVYFMVIYLVIFPRFGMLYQEKSGNPGANVRATHQIKRTGLRATKHQIPDELETMKTTIVLLALAAGFVAGGPAASVSDCVEVSIHQGYQIREPKPGKNRI
jgi:hypothetical protein